MRATLNDYESGLSAVAWEVMHRTQARHLFVTLEKRGMIVFERRSRDRASPEWSGRLTSEQLPSFSSYPVDRLGCGDALLATATLALAAGSGCPILFVLEKGGGRIDQTIGRRLARVWFIPSTKTRLTESWRKNCNRR